MRKEIVKFVVLALLAIGTGPASAALWQWSKTANSDATADPSIGWAEGMAPSAVNDSARAMMARTAEWRDDLSGLLATSGSSTAYTVTTNQTLCQAPASTTIPLDGQALAITVNATNGNSATLTADGCNPFPFQTSPGVAAPAGTLISGSPYTLKFSTANSAWMLHGFYGSALITPLGGLVPYTGTTSPNSSFVFAAGQCLSTTTYATYWAFLGSPAPGSCSSGQFAILDTSGRVLAGLDTMPGFAAANRLTSDSRGCGTAMTSIGAVCANGAQAHALLVGEIPSITSSGSASGSLTGAINAVAAVTVVGLSGGGSFVNVPNSASSIGVTTSGTLTASVTSSGTSGTPHPIVQPTIGITWLLRVL